jgi:hypothetical protein
MKRLIEFLVFGPEGDDQANDSWENGFREARSSGTHTHDEDEYDEEFHQSIRRRNTSSYSSRARRLDESGGGVIDLQVGSR